MRQHVTHFNDSMVNHASSVQGSQNSALIPGTIAFVSDKDFHRRGALDDFRLIHGSESRIQEVAHTIT
jgi:hypothetical protein